MKKAQNELVIKTLFNALFVVIIYQQNTCSFYLYPVVPLKTLPLQFSSKRQQTTNISKQQQNPRLYARLIP